MLPFVAAPWWLTIAFVTVAFVTIACAGHVAVKRTFRKADFIVHNEVAGFIIAVVGVLYAVLLGFLTIVVWEQYSQAEDRAAQEVDAATDVWRFAPYLEPADGKALTLDVGRYASAVLFDEWPKMRHGASSDAAQEVSVAALRRCGRHARRKRSRFQLTIPNTGARSNDGRPETIAR